MVYSCYCSVIHAHTPSVRHVVDSFVHTLLATAMVINNTDLATGFPRVSLRLSCHPEPLLHISATLDCAGAASTPMTLHGAAGIRVPSMDGSLLTLVTSSISSHFVLIIANANLTAGTYRAIPEIFEA